MQESFDNKVYCRMIFRRDKVIKSEKSFFINYIDLRTFVSEAGNLILQRLAIQQKKTGEVHLKGLSSQGNVVKVDYVSFTDKADNNGNLTHSDTT